MIDFYREKACVFSDEVESRLKELVVAHRIHVSEDGEQLPLLTEGRRRYETHEAITAFLKEIAREMTLQREMQGDSCKDGECASRFSV